MNASAPVVRPTASPEDYECRHADLRAWMLGMRMNVANAYRQWFFFLPMFVIEQVSGIASIVVFYMMATFVGGQVGDPSGMHVVSYPTYVLMGMILHRFLRVSLNAYYDAVADAYWSCAMEVYNAQPIGITSLLAGSVVAKYGEAVLTLVLYLVVGATWFGICLADANYAAFLLTLLLGVLATTGLGLISASFFFLLECRDRVEPVSWGLSLAASIASGVYFPPSILPSSLRSIGAVLPHTYCYHAARLALLEGVSLADPAVLRDCACIAGLAIFYLPLGIFCFAKAMRKAARDGSFTRWS